MKKYRAAVRGLTCTTIALCSLLIAACAGNGEGLDANGRPLGSGDTPPPPLSADFASIQANVFTPICSVCHVGGSAPQGLRLDADNSYNLLVGVPSTEVPSVLRVEPGDPDSSYIIQKLEGHAAVGAQMPFGCPTSQPCLPTTTIAFIRQWVTNGAPPAAAAAAVTAHLAMTATVPDSTEPVTGSPPQIMVAFNRDLDVSQLATHTVHIEKLAPGAAPVVAEKVPARITVPQGNLRALLIWPSRPLSVGRYRVVIDAESSASFSDIAGQSVSVGAPDELGESVLSTFDVEVLP